MAVRVSIDDDEATGELLALDPLPVELAGAREQARP